MKIDLKLNVLAGTSVWSTTKPALLLFFVVQLKMSILNLSVIELLD